MNIKKSIIALVVLLLGSLHAKPATYKGDLNGDGKVDMADMAYWTVNNPSGSKAKFDINADDKINDTDLHALAELIINMKLVDNSGVNVGIGDWDEDDEDFGGSVGGAKAPSKAAGFGIYSVNVTRDYSTGVVSRTFGVTGAKDCVGMLVDVVIPRSVEVQAVSFPANSVIADHKIWGTPKAVKAKDGDNETHYRFIIYSGSLSKFSGDGALFTINYKKTTNENVGSAYFKEIQTVDSANSPVHSYDAYIDYANWLYIPISSMALNRDDIPEDGLQLFEGDRFNLGLRFNPDYATNKDAEWTSSDESVAIYDSKRSEIEARTAGEAIITAKSLDGSGLVCSMKVVVKKPIVRARRVEIIVPDLQGQNPVEGTSLQLSAHVFPDETTDKRVEWISNDPLVATVDGNGLVSFLSPGDVSVFAHTLDGSDLLDERYFICVPRIYKATSVSIIDASTGEAVPAEGESLVVGDSKQFDAIVLPANTTDKSVAWSSSDVSVASIDENGYVRACSVGTAKITVTTRDGSNVSSHVSITVVPRLVEHINIIGLPGGEIKEGDTFSLLADVYPVDATDKSVAWSSSDASVASIDENGYVTACSVGTATITVTARDGSNVSSHLSITVVPRLVECIIIRGIPEDEIKEGDAFQLVAVVYPEDATDTSVTWSSSDASVASVDNGYVDILSCGYVTITARANDASGCEDTCIIYALSGIDSVIAEDEPFQVYDARGLLVLYANDKKDLESLPKGFYILKQGTETIKIMK